MSRGSTILFLIAMITVQTALRSVLLPELCLFFLESRRGLTVNCFDL